METLASAHRIKEILKQHQFTAKKNYGQNFLADAHVLQKIIQIADVGPEDIILEIGPGIGVLTEALCKHAKKVIAVEIDKMVIPILEENLSGCTNVTILQEDILQTDLDQLLANMANGQKVKVVANLPYYITTPIIMTLLEKELPVQSITVMVQKEVAQRLKAGPGTKEYGAITLGVQFYADVYYGANVPANCFIPRPNVDSAVIRMDVKECLPAVKNRALLFQIVRCAFGQRRKTFINALYNQGPFSITKEEWEDIFTAIGLDTKIRGEVLHLDDFIRLADHMAAYNIPSE